MRFLFLFIGFCVSAADWPTYRADASRSGVTTEQLALPLKQAWVHQPLHAPRPAWRGPAKRDPYNNVYDLKNRQLFDHAFHVVADAKSVYFGSSADDQVHCLNAGTGKESWTFFTEGPVRFAPTLHGGKLFVGSDDGHAYCLTTEGKLIWRKRLAPRDYRIAGNNRIISAWPVRTGILVRDGVAYAGAGMFPSEGVHVVAFSAADGIERWRTMRTDLPAQGYLLVSEDRVYVPAGRDNPVVFDRATGKHLHTVEGGGGTYALLTGNTLIFGHGRKGQIDWVPGERSDAFATFPGAEHIIVTSKKIFLQAKGDLSSINRVLYLKCEAEVQQLRKAHEILAKQLAKLRKEKPPGFGELQKPIIAEMTAVRERLGIVIKGKGTGPEQLAVEAKAMADSNFIEVEKAAEKIGIRSRAEVQFASKAMKVAEGKALPERVIEMVGPITQAVNELKQVAARAYAVTQALILAAEQAEQKFNGLNKAATLSEQKAKELIEAAAKAEKAAMEAKTKESEQTADVAKKAAETAKAEQKTKELIEAAAKAEKTAMEAKTKESEQAAEAAKAAAETAKAEQKAKELIEAAAKAKKTAMEAKTKESEQSAAAAKKAVKTAKVAAETARKVAGHASKLAAIAQQKAKLVHPEDLVEWQRIESVVKKVERFSDLVKVTCVHWDEKCKQTQSLILTGNALFAGGVNELAAYSEYDGKNIWAAPVNGAVHGIAVAHGRVLVSTDKGTLYCFTAK
jgi:outer membrane protein assembly factor BamB